MSTAGEPFPNRFFFQTNGVTGKPESPNSRPAPKAIKSRAEIEIPETISHARPAGLTPTEFVAHEEPKPPASKSKPLRTAKPLSPAESAALQTKRPPVASPQIKPAQQAPQQKSLSRARSKARTKAKKTANRRGWLRIPRRIVEGMGACASSTIFHMLLLVILAIILVPEPVEPEVLPLTMMPMLDKPEEEELRLDSIHLDEQNSPSVNNAEAITSSTTGEIGTEGLAFGSIPPPQVDRVAKGEMVDSQMIIDGPMIRTPPSHTLIEQVPDGALGDPRAIVDDYQEAMDRITRELLMLLDKERVLVIWCFDQSESMKDDQQEIRDRVDRIYSELGLSGRTQGGSMTTAVTSYGSNFVVHTKEPTANVDEIRDAIAAVPSDPTGKEFMCSAVAQSLAVHRKYAKKRQIALILVTDETGEKSDNLIHLETAIAEAKASKAICYVLGREAVFGYPYAHMRWTHPGTGLQHWLPVDRGPETAFVEQLQTDGFSRRHDAFASGFGSYEQCRLARETGGVFFMLPSLETSIVRGDNRRYELEAMRSYKPDTRSRLEIDLENSTSMLRVGINQVINELNPYNPKVQPHIELRTRFSPEVNEFVRQVQAEKVKALNYVVYLDRAEKVFASEEMQYARKQETSPRWQANYDLLYAQILAYKIRTYEYGAYLEWFMENPIVVPLSRSQNEHLAYWEIGTRRETLTGDLTKDYIEKSRELFLKVMENHPGTPWAARAQWELNRGFGVRLSPHYVSPGRPYSGPHIPIPKL